MVQMPKPNRTNCKNGRQTDLLVQGARSAAQKSQITVDTKISANNKVCIYNIFEWDKLPLSSKVSSFIIGNRGLSAIA